jgi:hypothetical protein
MVLRFGLELAVFFSVVSGPGGRAV